MVHDFIYPVLRCVHSVEYFHLRRGSDVGEVQDCMSELRFLQVCLWWFSRYDKDHDGEENWENLKSMLDDIGATWENVEGALASAMDALKSSFQRDIWKVTKHDFRLEYEAKASRKKETMDDEDYVEETQDCNVPSHEVMKAIIYWDQWSKQIQEKMEECKLDIRKHTENLLHCTFVYRSVPSAYHTIKVFDAILQHLKCIAGEAVPLKNQIETLEEKLMLLQAFYKLIPKDGILEIGDFMIGLYDDINKDVNKMAWLTFFFWSKPGDEKIAAELNLLLSDISRKIIKPAVPDVASWYFGVMKVMWLQQSENALLLGQDVLSFLDLLFEYFGVPLHEDFQILRDGLLILFTFLANPPVEYADDEELFLILDQLGDLLREQGSRLIRLVDDTKNDSTEKEVCQSDFVMMIERLKGKIRKLNNFIAGSSSSGFPTTYGLGFIDFLLQNLKEKLNGDKMYIPFAKHLIIKIEQALVSLRPDLDDIFELQKEHKELQETWVQLINLAYLTEHTVNSCSVTLYPIWYNMVRLGDILDEIKVVKGILDTLKHSDSYIAAALPKAEESNDDSPAQAWYLGANEVIVGCEEEVDVIVDQLTRGPKSLEIVSIVGMGGSGKSTLARKVYDTQQVRSCFHIFAFCTVSQVYSNRKLLLNILKDIDRIFDNGDSMTDDDLAHLLHQKLSGKRYLVVMDDIWKIDAWEKVKSSFPNENEGSRVIFTTREREVAAKVQNKFSPHSKHLLSHKDSWELLQKMAFPQGGYPPNLSDIGQIIVRNCGGLPLAVTVIGRLLARKERSLTLWTEIAEKTTSFASEEGCMKVLDLSYKHLPEHLKSCFLYFGVFEEDEPISAKRLTLLWIAEGFVQKSKRDSMEITAEEYLNELVDRNLVQAAEKSSDKKIKTCHLHDVIGDFCQRKAQEENLFQRINGTTSFDSSHSNRYRISLHKDWEFFSDEELRDPGIKSILYNDIEFTYECDGSDDFMFSKSQLVQVLDLEKVVLEGREDAADRVLESMTSLVHLRYIAISVRRTRHIGIPYRMVDLKNLETLIIRDNIYGLSMSGIFWRMERLRHLDVGECDLNPHQLALEAYPPLYNLECVSTLLLYSGTAMSVLKKLPNLRKLSCTFSPDSNYDSILALDVLSKLVALKLRFGSKVNATFPTTLKKLSLKGDSLPPRLGELPRLEVLKIDGYRLETWDVEDGEFPMLKFLKLENSFLREWNASDGSFPRLEQLEFYDCNYLNEIPASFGESNTLERIHIIWSNRSLASSACIIRDEQQDLGKEIELIISE